jgi:hypothetical protein
VAIGYGAIVHARYERASARVLLWVATALFFVVWFHVLRAISWFDFAAFLFAVAASGLALLPRQRAISRPDQPLAGG